jgi:hypothetical protein
MISVAVIVAVFFIPPHVYATVDGTQAGITPTPAAQSEPLYRARLGDVERREVVGRFYIERNIATAASQFLTKGDADPDGDGWALVGHTGSDNDGKAQTRFWIDGTTNVPHLLLNASDATTCAQLTPVSLAVVAADEDRLLRSEQFSLCMAPLTTISIGITAPPLVLATQAVTDLVQSQTVIIPQQSEHQTIQQTTPLVSGLPVQVPDVGHVAGVSTAKIPNYFDGPGKNTADVANEVGNTFLIGGSIMFAVLLGIVLLIRSLAIFST